MNNVKELYEFWATDPYFSDETRAELQAIRGNESEITERFYRYLEFGTGGLRGIIGAGTNRMNPYTIALATEGFARYLDGSDGAQERKPVVISYDCRHFSREFATIAALIFATHGIKVYLSDELRPTPMLSYAVRYFRAAGGVMITASHNPAKYNGYKAYGEDGGQMPPEAASVVLDSMASIEDIRSIHWITEEEAVSRGLLVYFGKEIDDAYDAMIRKLCINPGAVMANSDMKIVYTPLHGTANKPVRRVLREIGFTDVMVVPEQEHPDPDFSTVVSPNPEDRSALEMAISLAVKETADIVVATDPDGDRTALAVRGRDGEYIVLSGNQIGILLLEYILKAKKESGSLPADSFAITTIVSTRMSRFIAEEYQVRLFEVFTGFKFIAEVIKDHDEFGPMHFQFGFEESFGYLAGTDVRDKDAVVTVMLIAEMAAAARSGSKTLYDMLQELYCKYSFAAEKSFSIMSEGKEGIEKIKRAMTEMRKNKTPVLGSVRIRALSDYLQSVKTDFESKTTSRIDMEASDVLLYELEGQDWFCVRPSGTEPKIKIYFGMYGKDQKQCDRKLQDVSYEIEKYIRSYL